MNTLIMAPQRDKDSNSIESRITHHLMKDCYEKLISELGEHEVNIVLEKTWAMIEQVMAEKVIEEPVAAAAILFKENDYNKLLHTQCYAAIFWKENGLDGLKEH